MYRLLISCICFVVLTAWQTYGQKGEVSTEWSHDLKVEGGVENFDGEKYYAYSFDVFEAQASDIRNLVNAELKERSKDRKLSKKMASAMKVAMPKVNPDGVDVHVKFDDDKKSNQTRVSVAFLEEGKAISPESSPDGDRAIRDLLREYAVDFNKAVVAEQLEEQEKILADLQKDLDKAQKNKEKVEKVVTDGEEKIKKGEVEKNKLEQKLSKKKSDDLKLEAKYNTSGESKDLKKMADARKDVEQLEEKIGKIDIEKADLHEMITEAQGELPAAEELMKSSQEKVADQNALVEKFRMKLASIK